MSKLIIVDGQRFWLVMWKEYGAERFWMNAVRGEYKAKKKFLGRPHKIAILVLDAPMIFTPGRQDLDLDASNLFKKKLLFTGS